MPDVKLSNREKVIRSFIQHYNESKYWKYRNKVINSRGGDFRLSKIILYQKM